MADLQVIAIAGGLRRPHGRRQPLAQVSMYALLPVVALTPTLDDASPDPDMDRKMCVVRLGALGAGTPVGSVECGGEVGEKIVEGLQTDREADQPRVDGER